MKRITIIIIVLVFTLIGVTYSTIFWSFLRAVYHIEQIKEIK